MSIKLQMMAKKLQKKARKGFGGYPLATIAHYGPDNQRASKVAVSIVAEKDEVTDMKRWFSETGDVRRDQAILEAILAYLDTHGVRSVAMPDRIIGCPHEEGVDYPEGEPCPKCPYWAHRDRWSGEVVH